MPAIALSNSFRSLRASSVSLRLYHVGKAINVNTAIAKGIRKSKGLGFRGKEKPSSNDPRVKYIERNGIPRFTADPKPFAASGPQMTRHGWEAKRDSDFSKRDASDTASLRIRRGKKETEIDRGLRHFKQDRKRAPDRKASPAVGPARGRFGEVVKKRGLRDRATTSHDRSPFGRKGSEEGRDSSRPSHMFREDRGSSFRSRDQTEKSSPYESRSTDRPNRPVETYPSLSSRKPPFEARSRDPRPADEYTRGASSGQYESGPSDRPRDRYARDSRDMRSQDRIIKTTERYPSSESRGKSFESRSQESRTTDRYTERGEVGKYEQRSFKQPAYRPAAAAERTQSDASDTPSSRPRITQTIDNRIPLSIPYTTPASEFLYGTSVVEAVLSSRRAPRRKLYRLYIYTGDNREKGDQDAEIEKLARKNGVEVARVGIDWLRLLDKMSAGRPHNGYILEASPLPRLPVTSLGKLGEKDGQNGFSVVVDYQSREEAIVNGNESFIKLPRDRIGRKPLVLYLDSIQDPGNLGGIIRTASFLGVTAVGISTRNSAPFSPVVLKASAGASENVTLFSVNKPSGFIVDSKAAGWKVFAAVAPTKKNDPKMPMSISTNELDDPLSEDPCILMLGGEGEGLRWNLRSKADADLYIRGSGQSHNVDSLNVSVATGVLCHSFLRSTFQRKENVAPAIEKVEEGEDDGPKGDLF